jgi:hypothetical protein
MYMCHFKGCGKTEDLKEVVITFKDRVDAPESHTVEAVVQNLLVCPDHAHPQPREFVTKDAWNKIVASMLSNGFAAPAWESVKIVFRPTRRPPDAGDSAQ